MKNKQDIKLEFTTELKLVMYKNDESHGVDFQTKGNIEFDEKQAKELRNVMLYAISQKVGYDKAFVDALIERLDNNCEVIKSKKRR